MRTGTITQAAATAAFKLDQYYSRNGLQNAVYLDGVFGSATVALEVKAPGLDTWFPVKDLAGNAISLTARGYANFIVRGDEFRLVASGATGTTDIDFAVL